MDTYSFNNARYGTHVLIAEEIGRNKRVLDVGCNKGYLKLLAPANDFVGIDFNKSDLAAARQAGYQEVHELDLNHYQSFFSSQKFDVIVLADVLEHLMYPQEVLCFFIEKYLEDKGVIILSLPNVAHFTIRFQLLLGKFDYTENGILDKTHLHLYTKKSARDLILRSGLKIVKRIFSSNHFGRIIAFFPGLGGLLGFNLVFVCQKKSL